ncbi:MAG: queuosine precursor transporter, partial [Actinobacteria bacterium]|nr:queuosine precursor transporter [Actinomycetota bacterium]
MFLNLLLWVGLILGTFGLILLAYRLFGFFGLVAFSALALIIANIQVLKQVEILGLAATLGNVVFSATFLTTDIANEIYGKAKAKLAVHIGFFSMIAFLVLSQLTLLFTPAAGDWASPHLQALFSILPRITVASLVAYFLSNRHDVWA